MLREIGRGRSRWQLVVQKIMQRRLVGIRARKIRWVKSLVYSCAIVRAARKVRPGQKAWRNSLEHQRKTPPFCRLSLPRRSKRKLESLRQTGQPNALTVDYKGVDWRSEAGLDGPQFRLDIKVRSSEKSPSTQGQPSLILGQI
jgi:hypothetical protein